MTSFILPRRRFLFMAPAIVVASSLMPGHSIAKPLAPAEPPLRTFYSVFSDPLGAALKRPVMWGLTNTVHYSIQPPVQMTHAEVTAYIKGDLPLGWNFGRGVMTRNQFNALSHEERAKLYLPR